MIGNRAFSLVELLIVLVIVGIAAAIAAPRYGGATERYRARLAAQRLGEELRAAGERARVTQSRVQITLDAGADTVGGAFTSGPRSGQSLGSTSLRRAPYHADMTDVWTDKGAGQFSFLATGEADSDVTATLRCGESSVTVTVQSGDFKPRVGTLTRSEVAK